MKVTPAESVAAAGAASIAVHCALPKLSSQLGMAGDREGSPAFACRARTAAHCCPRLQRRNISYKRNMLRQMACVGFCDSGQPLACTDKLAESRSVPSPKPLPLVALHTFIFKIYPTFLGLP